MTILILYNNWEFRSRNTLLENIKSFENYSDHTVVYLNYSYGIPLELENQYFDLIVYHYSLLILKWHGNENVFKSEGFRILASLKGLKIAMPQDEYVYSDIMCNFIKDQSISTIYTCFFEQDYHKVYPTYKTNLRNYFTVFPGYVDNKTVLRWKNSVKGHRDRKIDLGYRARKNPFWLGSLGILKWKVTEVFMMYSDKLKMDISNDGTKVILGEKWYKFLAECRCVLGVESGSSLLDVDGSIRKKVDHYQKNNPEAEFDEVAQHCFPNMDWNIHLATLSPRHFEACITKTCQVLVEGEYAGVLKPGVHYIEIKKDWSNIYEVLRLIQDKEYCEQLAENAYNDIILSDQYSYKNLVTQICDFAAQHVIPDYKTNSRIVEKLRFRNKYPMLASPIRWLGFLIKFTAKSTLLRWNLLKYFSK